MGGQCVAINCTSRPGKAGNQTKKTGWHRFPHRNPELLQKWIDAVKRESWKPSRSSYLCSEHFHESDYTFCPGRKYRKLKETAVPSVFSFPHLPVKKNEKRKSSTPRSNVQEERSQEEQEKKTSSTCVRRRRDNYCFVPGCRTGYSGKSENISLFSAKNDKMLEAWRKIMPRKDKVFNKFNCVCELHFYEDQIIRDYKHIINGMTVTVQRGKPTLANDAIPSIFPYLRKPLRKKGKVFKRIRRPREKVIKEKQQVVKCIGSAEVSNDCNKDQLPEDAPVNEIHLVDVPSSSRTKPSHSENNGLQESTMQISGNLNKIELPTHVFVSEVHLVDVPSSSKTQSLHVKKTLLQEGECIATIKIIDNHNEVKLSKPVSLSDMHLVDVPSLRWAKYSPNQNEFVFAQFTQFTADNLLHVAANKLILIKNCEQIVSCTAYIRGTEIEHIQELKSVNQIVELLAKLENSHLCVGAGSITEFSNVVESGEVIILPTENLIFHKSCSGTVSYTPGIFIYKEKPCLFCKHFRKRLINRMYYNNVIKNKKRSTSSCRFYRASPEIQKKNDTGDENFTTTKAPIVVKAVL